MTIGPNTFALTGIPDPVKVPAIFARRVIRLSREIGILKANTHESGDLLDFIPANTIGVSIPVRSSHNKIKWEYPLTNGEKFTGFRYVSSVNVNDPLHAYAGTVPSTAEIDIVVDDDWEAHLIFP